MKQKMIWTLLASLLTTYINATHAADFCVTNSQQLQDALEQAEINAQNNHIKLVSGVYLTSNNSIPNTGFVHQNSMPGSLTISGGWSLSGSGNCYFTRVRDSAYATVLSGSGQDRVLYIAIGNANANITLSNLSINNGASGPTSGPTGGLVIQGFTSQDLAGDVLLDRMVFIGNEGNYHAALRIDSAGRVDVKNSLFRNNSVNISYTASINTDSSEAVYFTNNTVTSNHTGIANGVAGVLLRNLDDGGVVAANNIFWNNDFWDVVFSGNSANHHLIHNLYETAIGHAGIEFGNIQANPQFNTDYTLSDQSPAIDAGITPPENNPNPPVELDWTVGDYDVRSYIRTQGLTTDMGAMEYVDFIFGNGFD
ncbi:MAG: choice-of-anchor Q domain-containing protein [Marinicella sp.]